MTLPPPCPVPGDPVVVVSRLPDDLPGGGTLLWSEPPGTPSDVVMVEADRCGVFVARWDDNDAEDGWVQVALVLGLVWVDAHRVRRLGDG